MIGQKAVIIELVITSILVGLIWVIQLLTYPSFQHVDNLNYSQFHIHHVQSITPLVAPLMIAEVLILLNSLFYKNYPLSNEVILSCILIVIIWLMTAFISVPIHNKLVLAKDNALIEKLILTNWIRTLAWSLRLGLLLKISFPKPL